MKPNPLARDNYKMLETIHTTRLLLRPFRMADAPEVRQLASEYEIAANTLRIPHPYELAMAEKWIAGQKEALEEERELVWAVTQKDDHLLVGSVGLILTMQFNQAELGYWIGKPHWNNGYASEAAAAVIEFGFKKLNLHRIYAHTLSRNPASGRVLQKIGMRHEGCLREHIRKWGKFEDMEMYGILSDEFSK